MAGVNKAIIIGNLGSDPELKYTPSGQAVANFSVATTESYNDAQGQRQDRTEWHRIVVWGKQAETCGRYLSKGRQVFIEGKIQTRQWDDRDGNKRYTTEIVARDVRFLGNRDSNNAGMSQGGQGGGYQGGYGGGQSDQGGQGGGYGGGQGGGQGGGYQQPKNQGYGGGQDFEPHAVTDDDVPF